MSVVIDEEPNIFLILVEVLVTRYVCTQFQYSIYSICDRWFCWCVCIIQGLHLARSESENMPRIISGCSISKSYICIQNKKTELSTSQKWSWRAEQSGEKMQIGQLLYYLTAAHFKHL